MIAVMNIWFHSMWEISGVVEELLGSPEGFCSMELVS